MSLRRSGAPPSLEAANQAQIDDLVRRHRTLENNNKELSEQVEAEVARSKEALAEIQRQWHAKEKQWCDECDDLLACYRCIYLKALAAVETERINVLNEQKMLRREKLLRLQRDYRITLFHAKEKELEERIAELEEENEQLIEERKVLGSALRKRFADFLAQLRSRESEKNDLEAERDEMEEDLNKLREENAHLQASLESISSKLERTGLQLEGAQSKRTELEGLNDELKRSNHDLQRQLDKWQRLETKGDAELESLRKRKVELEVEAKELRDRLEKISDDNTKALEKEKRRVERMKETTSEWQDLAEKREAETKAAKQELAKLRKAYEELKMQSRNSDEPTVTRHASKPRTVSDSEESEAPNHSVPTRTTRTSKRQRATASDTEAGGISPLKSKRKRRMSPVTEEVDAVEEVEPPPKPRAAVKGKGKAKEKIAEDPTEISDDNSTPAAAPKARRKKKGASDSDSEAQKLVKQGNSKSRNGADEASKRKMTAAAQSKETINNPGNGDENEDVPKKKKRKINIFSTAQNGVFDFGVGLNGDGLGIPTSLSPVKEPDGPIPSRAIGGNALSNLGGIIRSRMISRT